MDFSLQKAKRCGLLALRPHRRRAVRVVFFAFISFQLALMLASGLFVGIFHALLAWIPAVGGIVSGTYSAAGGVFAASLLALPVWMGLCRWYWVCALPDQMRRPALFWYFRSFRSFAKSVLVGWNLILARLVFLALGLAPAAGGLLLSAAVYRINPGGLAGAVSFLCLLAGIGLGGCGIFAAREGRALFYWVPWLMARDPSAPFFTLFVQSARLAIRERPGFVRLRRRILAEKIFHGWVFPVILLPRCGFLLAVWAQIHLPEAPPQPLSAFRQRAGGKRQKRRLSVSFGEGG